MSTRVNVDIWQQPWALYATSKNAAIVIRPGDRDIVVGVDCSPIVVTDAGSLLVDGKPGVCEDLGKVDATRRAWGLPVPLRHTAGVIVQTPLGTTAIHFARLPDAPATEADPDSGSPQTPGEQLMDRVKRIWTRLKEVEEVIADPARMWQRLADLWLSENPAERPKMDEIVKQARSLPPVINELGKSPRRILRRIHKQIPLPRVQELDRRSMTWLIRQPGDTIVEQAGDRQSIMAVAREENFDTLENRVLLAYSRLARRVAADYAPATLKRSLRRRERIVQGFGRRCRVLASDLASRGVAEARPDVTPNYVLLNNPSYRKIWDAWHELLSRKRIFDELWRWQARSWEEFSALAVMVALQKIQGAEQVATSPIIFRDEQIRGCWVQSVNPLGVLHLTRQDVVIELVYSRQQHDNSSWCTPVYVRVGRIGDARAFLQTVLIWPIWSAAGGLVDGETSEINQLFEAQRHLRSRAGGTISGAIVLRPTAGERSDVEVSASVAAVTLGAAGRPLRDGIGNLSDRLLDLVVKGARR